MKRPRAACPTSLSGKKKTRNACNSFGFFQKDTLPSVSQEKFPIPFGCHHREIHSCSRHGASTWHREHRAPFSQERELPTFFHLQKRCHFSSSTSPGSNNPIRDPHLSSHTTKITPQFISRIEPYFLISNPETEWMHVSLQDVKVVASQITDSETRDLLLYAWRDPEGRKDFLEALRNRIAESKDQLTVRPVVSQSSLPHELTQDTLFGNKRKKSKQRWIFQYLRQLLTPPANGHSLSDSSLHQSEFIPHHTDIITKINHVQSSHSIPIFHQNVSLQLDEDSLPPVHLHFYIENTSLGRPLAVQYLSSHHYKDMYHATPLEITMLKDQERRMVCDSKQISLVEVPYWWDTTLDGLVDIIRNQVSELQLTMREGIPDRTSSNPASEAPTSEVKSGTIAVHDPTAVQKPDVWNGQDISNWWISKKYDGVRAICIRGKLYTKQGVEIPLPVSLQQQLDNCNQFDGELVSDVGGYAHIVSLMRQAQFEIFNENDWSHVHYMVFDIREENLSFEERQELLRNRMTDAKLKADSFVQPIEQKPLHNISELETQLDALSPSEEGYILVKPGSRYMTQRVDHVLKAKRFYDSEALFLGKEGNAFRVRLPNGSEMKARVSEEDFEYPHYIPGKTVFTLKYSQVNQVSGNPAKPMVYRERRDMTWEQVLKQEEQERSPNNVENSSLTVPFHSTVVRGEDSFATLFWSALEQHTDLDTDYKKQDFLNELILSCSQIFPLPQQVPSLAEALQLSESKFLNMLKKARAFKRSPPATNISRYAKNRIIQWIREGASVESRTQLLTDTGLSRNQLSRQIHLLKQQESIGNSARFISPQTKEQIRSWLVKHDFRRPNAQEREQLQSATRLTSKQLSKQIDMLIEEPGEITKESKLLLENWVNQNNGNTHPSNQQREELLSATGWNRTQLNKQLQILRNRPGKLSEESKTQFRNWIEERLGRTQEHDDTNEAEESKILLPLTKEERQEIMTLTGWSSQQLTDQLRRLDVMGGSTPTIFSHWNKDTSREQYRQIVSQWLKQHQNRSPSSEERDLLQQQTNLSRVQLNNLIHNLRNVGGTITSETHEIIDEWLRKTQYSRRPSQQEKEALCEATRLSPIQLMGQIRYKRKKEKQKQGDSE